MATEILPTIPQTSNQAVVSMTASALSSEGGESVEGEGGDFLSMIMSALSKDGKDVKNLNSLLPVIDGLSVKGEELLKVLPEEISSLELGEATFVQILQLLEVLNGKDAPKFMPKFDDKLKSILQNETIVEEFKNAKSIKDVLELGKKYNLGLENIKISSQDIKKMEKTFPILAEKGFFKQLKTQISSEVILKSKAKPKEENTTTLSSLLKDVKKDKKTNTKVDVDVDTNEMIKVKVDEKKPKIDKKIDSKVDEKIDIKEEIKNTKAQFKEDVKTKTSTDSKKVEISVPTSQNIAKSEPQINQNTNTNTNTNKTELTSDKSVNLADDAKQSNTDESNKQNSNTTGFAKEVAKPDNLQVKSSNLRQTLNTFAQDFKEQVEQYKPPVMKVQMSLNPKSLGEMEVTLINRGNNLHVNITSNTTAMNVFLQNQAEFKNSLVNMGFTNLEMNFSDKRQGQEGQNGTKFASENEEDFEEYANEETMLELTLPYYV